MNDAKTIGSNALVLDTAEENVTVMNAEESKLGKEVSLIEQRAEAVVVASGADFEDAGLFLKQIKQAQKQVKDYWEPLRVSAKKSYDEVLNHRKEMIEPLEKAEKIVKVKVNEYSAEQERKRREQEEAMRRLAQAEIDRHLNEAAEAEANGDAVGAEYTVWNIGHPVAGEYLPLCRLSQHQPFPGGQSIDVDLLKAIRCDGAQTILDAVGYGPGTLEEMERFVEKHKMARPGTSRYREVERMEAALPFMRSLQWR